MGRRNRVAGAEQSRGGFTLVELLVAMLIIIILAGITLAAVNIAANGDRIPGGARQTQSMLEGARDRAIYAGEPRGLRLVLDPNDPKTVSSFVFIGAPQSYGEDRGVVAVIEDPPASGDWFVVEENPDRSQWRRMVQRGLLRAGARITFGNQDRWYTLLETPSEFGATGRWHAMLSRDYQGQPTGLTEYSGLSYRVELAPSVLPNEEPRQMPRGIVVDLESSRLTGKIPSEWYNDNGTPGDLTDDFYNPDMDIVFNPQGTVHGRLAAQGVMHLLVADAVDVQTGFRVIHGNVTTADLNGDGTPDERALPEAVITVFTASGTIVVSAPDDTDERNNTNGSAGADGLRDDPWYLAEVGGEG